MVRITKVYTRTGDKGTTALIGGRRVAKDAPRIEAYGTVDELNATLGVARAALERSKAGARLAPAVARVQNELFNLGAELASPDAARRARLPVVGARHVARLEREIDDLNAGLPALASFVLPGGGDASAAFHLARTVCRRAERRVVALARKADVDPRAIRYLNRLSDALFVYGRWAARQDGQPEPLWEPDKT